MKNPSYRENKTLTSFLFLLSVVLSVLALVYRKPEAFTKPQFWAEDGVMFFQYFQSGGHTIFSPYAGYLHLIPRIVAMLTFHVISVEHMPLAYNIASLLIFFGLIWFIWWRTAFDPYTKFFVTLGLSLVPVGSEMVLCISNVQWYVNLFIPLIFLVGYSKKYVVLDGIVLFLVALTGPFSVVYLPVVSAIIWYRLRKSGAKWKNERWLFIVYCLATFIQLLVIKFSTARVDSNWSITQKVAQWPRIIYLHVTNPLGIAKLYAEEIHKGIFAILLLALLGWIFLCWRKLTKRENPYPFFLMLASFCGVLAHLYIMIPTWVPNLNPTYSGTRYFLSPCILFLWSIVIYGSTSYETIETGEANEISNASQLHESSTKASRINFLFLSLYTYYTVVMVVTIPAFVLADKNWPEQAKKLESFKKGHLEIPVNPDPWIMYLDK